MDTEFDEFAKLAEKEFGDKIVIDVASISQENLDKINREFDSHITQDDILNYGKQVWLKNDGKCPVCDSDLLGIFGSFEWGIIHGIGFCSSCNKINFRYYHYIGNLKFPIKGFSIVGF